MPIETLLGTAFPPGALQWLGAAAVIAALGLFIALFRSRKQIERLRRETLLQSVERVRSLHNLGSRVANELRNPLAAINGLVQLLARIDLDPRDQRRIGLVGTEIARMDGILRDYLSYSRPFDDLRLERIELRELLKDVASRLPGQIGVRGVRVTITADRGHLRGAFINLMRKALESGTRVEFSIAAGVDVVEVGISGDRDFSREKIERMSPSEAPDAEGTCLGFLLARNTIRQLGGMLQERTDPGYGTRMLVRFPLEPDRRNDGQDPARG